VPSADRVTATRSGTHAALGRAQGTGSLLPDCKVQEALATPKDNGLTFQSYTSAATPIPACRNVKSSLPSVLQQPHLPTSGGAPTKYRRPTTSAPRG
jgi:hypothetical protein